MTAPDASAFPMTETRPAITLRVGLEWYLNPDHLALIAVRERRFGSGGIDLVLDEPKDHYDGFAALEQHRCDLILTEPLHLLEPMAAGCEALGCIFATRGGVLVREDRLGKLRGGELLRVASPVSSPIADRLCRRILQGWAGNSGFAVAETQIMVEPAGFHHVDNLQAGYDAAWLAFANIEAVEAAERGLAVRLITAEEGGIPGFSALELVARRNRSADEAARHDRLIGALEEVTAALQADPVAAISLWQAVSGDGSEKAAKIVRATLPCLKARVDRRPERWQALSMLLEDA